MYSRDSCSWAESEKAAGHTDQLDWGQQQGELWGRMSVDSLQRGARGGKTSAYSTGASGETTIRSSIDSSQINFHLCGEPRLSVWFDSRQSDRNIPELQHF